MSGLTWLHISDWHHGDFPIDPEVVRDKLVEDIKGRLSISPDLARIDFIVFSGDAALNGKAKEYEDAKKEFFVPVLEAAQVEPDRLFIVPGNHDLDEDELKKLPDEFQKDAISREDADRWLKDDSKRELLLRPFRDFRSFVSGFTGQDSPDYSDVREINAKKIYLLGINSAWFCRRHVDASGKQNDYGFARVGERQVHRKLERIPKSYLKIAVLHHSQNWLEYSDGEVVWRRLRQGCNFILHGHGHIPKVTAEHGTGGDCVIIPAGASFERRAAKDPSHINSYNFVHIDFETGKGFVFLRRWIDERSVWDKDIQTYEEGKFPFDLPGHSAVPHQISRPPEDFTGRSDMIEKLLAGFHGGAAIAGLRGIGGEGKTALALVLAKELAGNYPDGQLFLNMQGTSSSPLKPEDAMAHVVRSYKGADCPLPKDLNGLSGLYQTVLSGKKALVLLDNAASREQVEPLLLPPGSALLVTSRIKFAVPGLLKEMDLDPGVLPQEDANKLLLKICGRIGDHADELAKLCGCLPIALRNAAYALKEKPNLSLEGYIERLGDAKKRLELVEASFSTSYELLTPELKRLWSMLSVFPADFDLAGAAAVWEMEEMPAEDALSELIRWSLVDFLPSATGKGGRYRLHDLARDFADSRLNEAESEPAKRRHAEHYMGVLALADEIFKQGKEATLKGLQLFDQERANILAGQSWAEKNLEKISAATELCKSYPNAGVYVLDLRLSPGEKIPWIETALEACRRTDDKAAEGTHLGNLGVAYSDLGEPRKAIEFYKQALKILREIGDRRGEGSQLGNLGNAYYHLGEPRKAIEFYEQVLMISREIGDFRSEGASLGNLGNAYSDLGEPRKAIEFYEQALKISKEIGDRRGEEAGLCNLGNAYSDLGEPRKAIEFYEQALKISKEIGDRRGEGAGLGNLGVAYYHLGDPLKAIEFYEQALKILREIGDRRGEVDRLGNLGVAYSDLGEPRKAIEFYKQALKISREIGGRQGEGSQLGNLGIAYYHLGDPLKAIEFYEQALKISREIGYRRGEGEHLGNLGLAYYHLSEYQKAIEFYEQALKISREIGDRRGEGNDLGCLGWACYHLGESLKSIEFYEQALKISREIGDRRGEGNRLLSMSLPLQALGQQEKAISSARSALAIFEQIESPNAETVRKLLAVWGA